MLYDLDKRSKRSTLNPGFWRDFHGKDVLSDYNMKSEYIQPATNIIDNKEEYLIELATPGLCKTDFSLEVENELLKITGEKKATKEKAYTRREFDYAKFDKTFQLPEHIKHDQISASCADGILTIHIPKKDNTPDTTKKSIEVN